jgi:hypothetical protein
LLTAEIGSWIMTKLAMSQNWKKEKEKRKKKTMAPVAIQQHKWIIIYFYLHIWLIAKFDKHSTERWPLWLHHKTGKKKKKTTASLEDRPSPPIHSTACCL